MAMPIPWQRGYDWAQGKGPHGDKDYFEAVEAYGWAFDTPESRQFGAGSDCFYNEQDPDA